MRFVCLAALAAGVVSAQSSGLSSPDLYRLRSVGEVALSPDGAQVAYGVSHNDGPLRPYSQIHVLTLVTGKTVILAKAKEGSSDAVWSKDGQWLAYEGTLNGKSGLIVSRPDGTDARYLAPLQGTNHPIQGAGARITWSPDSKRLAFVSAVPGPETAEAGGDPIVITRYIYKPDHAEGNTRFNDNRRLHIFVADLASGQVRPLTSGNFYEHSVDWAPSGEEILFVSHREPVEDIFFNHDLFTVNASTGAIRRLTATEGCEFVPRWSPDGKAIAYLATRRGITDLETTMEDTHVWVMNADGSGQSELPPAIDNRQRAPQWSPDGRWIYHTVSERGSDRLVRRTYMGRTLESVATAPGAINAWSLGRGGMVAYAYSSPSNLSQLYVKSGDGAAVKKTDLNAEVLRGKALGVPRAFTFISNDNRFEVEAYLTPPPGRTAESKHPLIVVIHGGPHGFQGPAFNFKNQVYAARGWATLMVNYRGSTSYGQKFSDAVFGDQNGNEAQDVLYGVSAALRRNLWIDRDRLGVEGGSYGGQLSSWLITQTRIFKAAIPLAPVINLVSYNYTTYYNMYEQMTFGLLPHQSNLMDELWNRSSLKYVSRVATPTLLLHGENDNDVPIGESEQFYIALRDVGVKAALVRYPREGHGLREPKHIVDSIDRSIRWYDEHFPALR